MKMEDLEQGTIVALEDVIGDQTTIVAVFKGWTTGNSGLFPHMFFWNLTARACGTKDVAPIIIDPMASTGEIRALLTPKEYKEITEKNNFLIVKIFILPEVVPKEEKSRILSLPPSK